ncbi:OmpA family protein [Alcanivorax sp. S6407]|uniref:OmpA family protein n=1 Tax=Alcanivorax sp. S6407 TaxID=2926424 RepID=UPI001FF103E8|nr:OmpA family protein [Alcanivorax sp. S6407]MCK0154229.1 OmpA family protein [Alcanivorax sp. S6407]
MKRFLVIAILGWSEWALASANCQHSQSWQCQQQNGGNVGAQLNTNAAGGSPTGVLPPAGGGGTGTQPVSVVPVGVSATTNSGTSGPVAPHKLKKIKASRPTAPPLPPTPPLRLHPDAVPVPMTVQAPPLQQQGGGNGNPTPLVPGQTVIVPPPQQGTATPTLAPTQPTPNPVPGQVVIVPPPQQGTATPTLAPTQPTPNPVPGQVVIVPPPQQGTATPTLAPTQPTPNPVPGQVVIVPPPQQGTATPTLAPTQPTPNPVPGQVVIVPPPQQGNATPMLVPGKATPPGSSGPTGGGTGPATTSPVPQVGQTGGGTPAQGLLILNNGKLDQRTVVHKDNARTLQPKVQTFDRDVQALHLEVAGIRVPEMDYNFIERPVAPSGTYVFYFDFASAVIHQEQMPVFDRIVATYNNRGTPITVIGETDGFGSHAYNDALARHRSGIIIEELIRRGIPASHISEHYEVRCCRQDLPLLDSVAKARGDRITWVHFD